MNDRRKTKAQLIEDLQVLRRRLAWVEENVATAPASGASDASDATDPDVIARLASHGTWVVDTDFIVRVANEQMCRLLEKPAEEVVGRKCYDLMHGPRCHSEQCVMRRAFARQGSVAAREKLESPGRVPLSCRVVAHLVYDKSHQAVGIVEHLDEAPRACETNPGRVKPNLAAQTSQSTSLPTTHELAEVALEVAESLRRRLPHDDDAHGEIAKLETVCARFQKKADTDTLPASDLRKPALRTVAPHRSVFILAPRNSCIRGDWTDVVRRAGYALRTCGESDIGGEAEEPIVAILDLEFGEPRADDLHGRLRLAYPQVPILVVSSPRTEALEARRWRRAHTWYVPRTTDGDELVRLIKYVTSKTVLRSRPER